MVSGFSFSLYFFNELVFSTAEELYNNYDMSEMAFNPSIPLPKKAQQKTKPNRIVFKDEAFESECKKILKNSQEHCTGFLSTPFKLV